MKATGLLLLLCILQGGSCNYEDQTFCAAQRGSVFVEEKGSVTIPCNFTYPEEYRSGDIRVSWRRGGMDRCGNGELIYNQTEGFIHKDYKDRISSEENNKEKGTTSITIRNLRRTDGPTICCRIEIYEGSKNIQSLQNRHGTHILFKDEFSVEQADVVPAIIGEDITIPCVVHYKDSSVIEEVTWSVGSNDLCYDNNEIIVIWNKQNKSPIGRWSVVNFPQNLSLRIKEVTSDDNKRYCCKVRTKLWRNNVMSPIRSTQVILTAGSKDSKLKVSQPKATLPDQDGSATLSCSYQSDPDPLWTAVFWRAGGPGGIYVYHPLPEMIDSKYRGRTELRGSADLHIKGVNDADNTTYYCSVMLRFCVGNNKTNPILQYGSGTKLHENGLQEQEQVQHSQILTLAIYLGVKHLIVLALMILALLYLQKRSLQSEGGQDLNLQTLET